MVLGDPFGKNLFPNSLAEINAEDKVKEQDFGQKYNLDTQVPAHPQKFYEKFGLLEHPKTREPVKKLTAYQIATWLDGFRYKYRLTVKSQKTGVTTSSLIEDFQKAVIPTHGHPYSEFSTMGRETLIIAQKFEMAKEHLTTLYQMLVESEEYSDWIITKPSDILIGRNKSKTKANMLYIQNPENPKRPTRFIALGPRASGVWSWKNVKHIHMSDVAATDQIDDSQLFGAAFSRLANTGGTMHIETPPRGTTGKVWDIYQQSELQGDEAYEEAKFKVRKIYATEAVEAGLMTQEFLDQERVRLGTLYGMFYECEFLNPTTSWYSKEMIHYDNNPEYVEM